MRCTALVSPLLILAPAAPADDVVRLMTLPGFPQAQRAAYLAYEDAARAIPSKDSLLAFHQLIASEPHVAGTPGDLRNVDRIVKAFEDMGGGIEVRKHEFFGYLCRPISSAVEIIQPDPVKLLTAEEPLPEDKFSSHPDRLPGWNAYSGNGDVSAGVVYANYGTKADFASLAELKVDPKGKIVLCRYGGNFRGYKVKFAEDAGAAGVIIFTDPADAGFGKGAVYPEGGYANSTCIERGSITTLGYSGDPLTPGIEATKDAKRLDPAEVHLPKIPVQPISYAAAEQILKRMKGDEAPEAWRGKLPVTYRLGGDRGDGSGGGGEADNLKVRLKVEQKREVIPSFNIIATLAGDKEPEKKVILGCHHDAWVCGASDPTCGTITLLEAARSFADLAKKGQRPARTMLFCAWGAEEFGIIGSTEWVEGNREDLGTNAVAYINLDMASMGPEFGAAASPPLRRLIAQASQCVPQARDASSTVFKAWLARGEDPVFFSFPKIGDMGGGSDHVGFLCHAGVPSASMSGGGAKGTAYHSTFDTLPWYWKTVGEDYEPALMVTRMTIAVAGRLANSPLLPLTPSRYAGETLRLLADLTKRGQDAGLFAPVPAPENAPPPVAVELAALASAAAALNSRAGGIEAKLTFSIQNDRLSPGTRARINDLLMSVDRAWLTDEGIPGRPWFRNLFSASDEDSGYAAWSLPGLRWAIEHKSPDALSRELIRYLGVFQRLNGILDKIDAELK